MHAHGLLRAGATRKLAAFIVAQSPRLFAVSAIPPGDARSLATRFALQWAYRGRQAIFWDASFTAERITADYLPGALPLRATGLVRVDGELRGPCTLLTSEFSSLQTRRSAQLQFAYERMAAAHRRAIVFANIAMSEVASELQFNLKPTGDDHLPVYIRGFDDYVVRAVSARV